MTIWFGLVWLDANMEQVFYHSFNTAAEGLLYYFVLSELFYVNRLVPLTLDLSKVFDSVRHKILLDKLEYYDIRRFSLWNFRTELKKIRIQYYEYEFGILQGSILGPFLFITYTNNLPSAFGEVEICQYADGTSLLVRIWDGEILDELSWLLNAGLLGTANV